MRDDRLTKRVFDGMPALVTLPLNGQEKSKAQEDYRPPAIRYQIPDPVLCASEKEKKEYLDRWRIGLSVQHVGWIVTVREDLGVFECMPGEKARGPEVPTLPGGINKEEFIRSLESGMTADEIFAQLVPGAGAAVRLPILNGETTFSFTTVASGFGGWPASRAEQVPPGPSRGPRIPIKEDDPRDGSGRIKRALEIEQE